MKKPILYKILELTNQQTKALETENLEMFESLMQEKQIEIDKLEVLSQGQNQDKTSEENGILREIIERDKANRIEFTRQFEEVQKKMRQIRSQKKAGHVYSNPYDISREEGIFFDKK